jgi:hypothetical protein
MKVIIHGSGKPKPVRPPAGVLMTDSTMSPVYEAGDTLLLDATGPHKTGHDYVFCAGTSGDVDARVGRLVASTSTHWSCRQWNPQRIIRLDRAEWPHAILIAGAYRRGSRLRSKISGNQLQFPLTTGSSQSVA